MPAILRHLLALLGGLLLGGLVNMGLVLLGPHVIPPPEGVDLTTAEGLAAGMALMEPRHFLFPFLAHAGGTFAGALATFLLGSQPHRGPLALVVGLFFLVGGIMASLMIPAPGWFIAADLTLAYVPAAWLATRLGRLLSPDATVH